MGHPKKGARYEIDVFTMLASEVNALFQKVDHPQTTLYGSVPNGLLGQANVCEVCGV